MSNNDLPCHRCKGQHHPAECPLDNERELKPCPFCQEKAAFYKIELNRIMHKEGCFFIADTIINIYNKQAVEAWNRRV